MPGWIQNDRFKDGWRMVSRSSSPRAIHRAWSIQTDELATAVDPSCVLIVPRRSNLGRAVRSMEVVHQATSSSGL